ncbi:MAG: hypothetical protein GQ564_09945 [Bacteroidales bacterium]|nr:hypothetical protein [Bacteroidales bacterium]
MRIILTISIFIFLIYSATGQVNNLQTKRINDEYSWRTLSNAQLDSFYFNLQPIQQSNYKVHLRISLTGQIVDLYSSNINVFQGSLTNYISEYKSVKDKSIGYEQSKQYQYIFEKLILNPAVVEQMVQRIIKTGQPEIPTDTLITAWNHLFLHCNTLNFEFNQNGKYCQQSFHCPWGQEDTVQFRNIILENYNSLKAEFQLDSLYKEFETKLTKGKTYSKDGHIMMYLFTEKQSENWKKNQPVRDYLKSVKDTIDNNLETELSKKEIQLDDIDCFDDYLLIFGKNGKLKKVNVLYYKPKLKDGLIYYIEDKREIRKCKKKIRNIFENIDLSYLDLKYEIQRVFSFNNKNEYQLRDETNY